MTIFQKLKRAEKRADKAFVEAMSPNCLKGSVRLHKLNKKHRRHRDTVRRLTAQLATAARRGVSEGNRGVAGQRRVSGETRSEFPKETPLQSGSQRTRPE